MVDEQDKPAGPNESKVVPINGAAPSGPPTPQTDPEEQPPQAPEPEMPDMFDDMPPPDWTTEDIDLALREYEAREEGNNGPGMDDHPPEEAPTSAAAMNQQTRDLVASMAGEEDEEPDEPEQAEHLDHKGGPAAPGELPDLEIKSQPPEPRPEAPATQDQPAAENAQPAADEQGGGQAEADKAKNGQTADDNEDEDPEKKKAREQSQMPMGPGYPAPQMMQMGLFSALGYGLGSVLHGVGSGVVSLFKGALGRKPQDEKTPGNTIEQLNVDAAAKPANDEAFNQNAAEWRQNRLNAEYEHMQKDMDAHLNAVDRLAETEWAKTLKSIENNPDPEVRAKAPAILKEAKQKLDFRRAEGELSGFEHVIEQRAERIAGMANGDSEKLEAMFNQWQEETKKRLDKIPESEEKTGLINRIQGMVSNMMAGLQALFSKSSMSMK